MFATFTIGSTIVILLTVRKSAVLKFTLAEKVYVAIAILGIILWQVSADKNPTISIAANIIATVMGGLPTITKSYLDPASEDPLTWKLFALGGTSSVLAISEWTFVAAAAPIAVALLQLAIVVAGNVGKKRKIASA
jgi:hypothetical protein